MVKHIVLFQIGDLGSPAEKEACLQEIKSGLESLVGVVPVLRSLEVGINRNPGETYDLALVAAFDTLEDVQRYAEHPAHQAVSRKIGEVKTDRACVDYFFES